MFKKYKILIFTGRIKAFRVIERLERMNILGGKNTESVINFKIKISNKVNQWLLIYKIKDKNTKKWQRTPQKCQMNFW